jgi:GT2 family glycosyltransferase
MPTAVDVLIPTRDRVPALAVTLSGLLSQGQPLRVVVADQSTQPVTAEPIVAALLRLLRAQGHEIEIHRRPVRRGMAEQRAFLLAHARASEVLFLDDDVWLHPWALGTMRQALEQLGCGFVGMAVQGLSYLGDVRPHQWQAYEEWPGGRVEPERVVRGTRAWDRHQLHNAANLTHLAERIGATPQHWRAYKIAWIGACVLYRRAALEAAGGFEFWRHLPAEHAGEDVVPQLRVMERFGGAGIIPSGSVHLELPTTVDDRRVEVYDALGLAPTSTS